MNFVNLSQRKHNSILAKIPEGVLALAVRWSSLQQIQKNAAIKVFITDFWWPLLLLKQMVNIARKRRWTSELKVTAVAYERTGPILQRQRRLGWEFWWAWRSRKFAGAFVRELDVGFKIPTAPSIPYRSLNLSSKYTTRTGFHASRKIAEPISGISPPAGR
jgi:hypothetical protein